MQLNKEVDKLTTEERFSYRYAMGEWNERDDRIISDALRKYVEAGGVI
jgi:hypothetical protein